MSASADPRRGYAYAVLTMVVSGVAIYVNSLGVRTFSDSTLYTALKNAVTGAVLLAALALSRAARRGLRGLTLPEGLLLAAVAVIGGSLSYALYFRGLQLSTPVTASLIDHTQFLLVAAFAAAFLGERFSPAVWAALLVLFAGLVIGLAAGAVRWDAGVILVTAATILFAADFVLMKYLLRSVPALLVMASKMGLGTILLLAWAAASGHLGLVPRLSALQWGYVVVTGLILLAFTVSSVAGLRHASATAATAIPAGAPIITTALVVISRGASVAPSRWLGLALALAAVLVFFFLGRRRELAEVSAEESETAR